MVAVGEDIQNLQSLFDCAICLENCNDPRILQCGHHFCNKCLFGILDKQQKREIPCPSCRRVTDLPPGNNVSDLPRPLLINELQEKIAGLLKTTATPDDARMCDLCTDGKVTASFYCGECDQNFCHVCHGRHDQLEGIEGHAALLLQKFCPTHHKKKIVMYCRDCYCFGCAQCILVDHYNHDNKKIQDVVAESRSRLEKFIKESDEQEDEVKQAELIKITLKDRIEDKTKFLESTSSIRKLLKIFENKLDAIERGTNTKMSAEIETLSRLVSEAECLISSKRSLSERARTLLDTATEQDLVIQERKFPTVAELGTIPRTLPDTDSLRGSREMLGELTRNIQRNINICEDRVKGFIYCKADPMSDLALLHKIRPGVTVCGLTMDVKRQRIVVRTHNDNAPINVYDQAGVLQEQVGADVEGIVEDRSLRGIAIDTKRDLYLVPCESSLKLLDTKGVLQSSVRVGSDLYGVGYCQDNDVYVVSDVREQKVYVINARTKLVITQFGSQCSRDTQFNWPLRLWVGKVTCSDKHVIVVSDYGTHGIKVFDMSGRHVRTVGGPGIGLGQLQRPRGVAIDPAGRIIVADTGNQRVVSYWPDNGQDQWRCLLGKEQLGNEPYDVVIDPVARVMVVDVNDTVYVYKAT